MKAIHAVFLSVLVGFTGLHSSAQTGQGFTKSYHTYQNTKIPFYTFVPAVQDPLSRYPLVFCLHGSGERGDDPIVLEKNSIAKVWADSANQARWPCMVVVPQCPIDRWWSEPPMLSTLNNLLDSLVSRYQIDTNRIYLTGLSMGGAGTWDLAIRHPERFAAAVIVCGFGDPSFASVLRNLPIWFFHGANDPVVPVAIARAMVAAIESTGVMAIRTAGLSDSVLAERMNNGASLLYTEYPFGGHDVWNDAYHHSLLLPWVFSKVRPATSTLMYVRSVEATPFSPQPRQDTVTIKAIVNNPGGLTLAVAAFLTDWGGSQPRDSLRLRDDGMHGDGVAGDGIWGGAVVPTPVGVYSISVGATDPTMTRSSIYPDAAFFATAGLISMDRVLVTGVDTNANPGDAINYLILLKNQSSGFAVKGVTVTVTSPDTVATILGDVVSYGDLPGGAVSAGSRLVTVQYSAARPGTYEIPFTVEIASLGIVFWRDHFMDEVTAVSHQGESVVKAFGLDQNYPNPFNPSTTIKYELPHSSHVTLKVYNTLGQDVATIVDEVQEPGYKSVGFNGSQLSSGVYFYRLQAGNFIQTRKLLLLR